ncbi:MAG: tRNA threonylcarbamoyladenosine dehydratase [Clostridiales bacterium]|nr:tRNA threonylcarbamoyladenosine dehydratase [Clostridiales bacterium]
MSDFASRTIQLIGPKAYQKLQSSCICVIGLGGVGSYVVEGLVRAGIGKLIVIDCENITKSNLNRQIIALNSTVGQAKIDAICNRAMDINKLVNIKGIKVFIDEKNIEDLLKNENIDYIVDAIDSVSSKIAIIKYSKEKNIPIISSMGTGNKVNPILFDIKDIFKTTVCPLARKVRTELRKLNIKKVDVLFSTEIPHRELNDITVPASISFVPSVAGLLISGYVINKITGI